MQLKKEPKLTVGVMTEKELSFMLNGDYIVDGEQKNISGKHKATLSDGKITINKSQYDDISFIPTNDDCTFELIGATIGKEFHWEQKENLKFKGTLRIIIENSGLTAINILPIEEYLASVISSEMSATSSIELLKAHAVISRSWVLAQINKRDKEKNKKTDTTIDTETTHIKWYDRDDHDHFDVCADDHCQRYQGITRETTATVSEAIRTTRGEVLQHEGEICDARFSKSCGGVSETFENCWDDTPRPYLKKVIDSKDERNFLAQDLTCEENAKQWIMTSPESFCNTKDEYILSQVLVSYDQKTTDFYRWTVEYTQKELSRLIKKKTGFDFGEIIDLIPEKRGESGRIVLLRIVGTNKTLTIGKELEIRKTLSDSHLYSSAFIVEKEMKGNSKIPSKFTLYGAGWGHGVGLCQIGAAVMASKGYGYKEILKHYYKNADIEKLW